MHACQNPVQRCSPCIAATVCCCLATQTYEGLIQAFKPEQLIGVQEEVQLREQDFGNFQVRGLG